jgi:hypothetical protein
LSFNIRQYEPSDFDTLSAWWVQANEPGPTKGMMPYTTYVCTQGFEPIASISLITTNANWAMLENLIAKPSLEKNLRREVTSMLVEHACKRAKQMGYQALVCMSYRPKLTERYKSHGFSETLTNVTTLIREIK